MEKNDILDLHKSYITEFEEHSKKHLPKIAVDFFNGGAGSLAAVQRNTHVFSSFLIIPRVLRDVSQRDLSVTILHGSLTLPYPIFAAPTAFHGFAHPNGEIETAKGCRAAKTLMVLSNGSSKSLEEVAAAVPDSPKLHNIYVFERIMLTALIRRVEAAGFLGLCISVDVPVFGLRKFDVNVGYLPIVLTGPTGSEMWCGNFPPADPGQYAHGNPKATWDDIKWIRKQTKLLILIKGILHPDDARKAVEAGADGIVVSNHGGRQLEGSVAPLDVLPAVVKAVAGKVDVFVDGGIRSGSDVFKALARGAKAVFVGRPVIWGLAAKGSEGIQAVFAGLRKELDSTMALTGCSTLSDISSDLIVDKRMISHM